jgi:7,8-dihydro-6-hydroxymethylpterin dimethyltransferase
VDSAANDTFDKSGIAKNAREEKIRARDQKLKDDAENARMAKLYRKEILKEPELPGGFVAIGAIGGLGGIKPAAPVESKAQVVTSIEETVAGD